MTKRVRTHQSLGGQWREHSRCRGANPELFSDDGSAAKGNIKRNRNNAKAICLGCVVVNECLFWALTEPEKAEFEIWGGMGTRERRKALRDERAVELLRTMDEPNPAGLNQIRKIVGVPLVHPQPEAEAHIPRPRQPADNDLALPVVIHNRGGRS